ncbi:MAG: hydroxyacid dehydrogenase [Treponema sp.]|jgi:D-3-phosphoglycerate dehydrogenase|nr:hydroxyacid dehydrogenase [Treponema sp.]
MGIKILIPRPVSKDGTDYLLEQGYELVCRGGPGREEMLRNLPDCQAILLRGVGADQEILEAGKALRIVACHGAGYGKVDTETASRRGIWVTNTPLSAGCSVAEYAMTLILMLAKRIPLFMNAMQEGGALRTRYAGVEIENKTLGIIGLGRIGVTLARKALNGFGMQVFAYDPLCSPDRVPPGVSLQEDLETVLAVSDFVSLHVPNIPETKRMFGAPQFQLMKPGAYFINCSRGEAADQGALAEALAGGTIAGAALDVYDPEPPGRDNPLLGLPNVIATPRIASRTVEADIKMALHAAMEIHRVLSGDRPLWPVNRPFFIDEEGLLE